MNWDRIKGDWKQIKGRVRQQWGKLTDDDMDMIAGQREELSGKIQKAYGVGKDEANRQIEQFATDLDDVNAYDDRDVSAGRRMRSDEGL